MFLISIIIIITEVLLVDFPNTLLYIKSKDILNLVINQFNSTNFFALFFFVFILPADLSYEFFIKIKDKDIVT